MIAHMTNDAENSDEVLFKNYLAGDYASFDILHGRYAHDVYLFARSIVHGDSAEDIAQEVFAKIHSSSTGEIRFRPWLFKIVKNTAIDHLRKMARNATAELTEQCTQSWEISPSAEIESQEEQDNLKLAIKTLFLDYQDLIERHYFQGLSCREIAVQDGIPEATAKSRIRRALESLATSYGKGA